jgi:hypothetical protein
MEAKKIIFKNFICIQKWFNPYFFALLKNENIEMEDPKFDPLCELENGNSVHSNGKNVDGRGKSGGI